MKFGCKSHKRDPQRVYNQRTRGDKHEGPSHSGLIKPLGLSRLERHFKKGMKMHRLGSAQGCPSAQGGSGDCRGDDPPSTQQEILSHLLAGSDRN